MPQTNRKDSMATSRGQDKESKRARGALSCAECRRLKLKCDKTVPCSSCKRRGCSAICPNGSLITGQGTRFVLADTQKLHEKIAQMSDRIRLLEDALSIAHSSPAVADPHPLLDRELLKIKSIIELHAAIEEDGTAVTPQPDDIDDAQYIDAFGTLALRDDGASTFYGRSAGSESLLIGARATEDRDGSSTLPKQPPHSGLSAAIRDFSSTFPLASFQPEIDFDYLVHRHLPSWMEGSRLTTLYMDSAPWFFCAVGGNQIQQEILPMWYDEAPRPLPEPTAPSLPAITSPVASTAGFIPAKPTRRGPHELALLFMIFCFGAMTDANLPPDNQLSDQYYTLTKASLNLEPVLDRPPSVSTVQTLAMMAIYEGMRSGENSIESTWAIMGMATKLAQSIGLHRDCARWKLPPAEVQKRRALFWELFITDGWQSLATGRLATFSLPFVDCELPFDQNQTMDNEGTAIPSFSYWKARFGAECVAPVVQGTLTSRAPKYSVILELDRKVRDMELPKYAQGSTPHNAGLSETMSHFMPFNYRHLTLLYIHRCFFTHAISTCPEDPIKSQYAPSFLAGYRSACELLSSVKRQFTMFPQQIARFWVLWTHAFSSTVLIASVVTNAPKCKVAPAALLELGTACELFEAAATHGGRAVKFLPIIKHLRAKAQKVYYDTISGMPPAASNDMFRSTPEGEEDEMAIFGGKTYTVTTKASPSAGTTASRSPSNSPQQSHLSHAVPGASFEGAHPMLVEELQYFDGHIDTQIETAMKTDQHVFNRGLTGNQRSQHYVKAEYSHIHFDSRQQPDMPGESIQSEQFSHYFTHPYQQQQREHPSSRHAYQNSDNHHPQHHVEQPHRVDTSHLPDNRHHYVDASSSYSMASLVEAQPRGMAVSSEPRTRHTLSQSQSHPNLHEQTYQHYPRQEEGPQHQNGHSRHMMYSMSPEFSPHQQQPRHTPEVISPASSTHSSQFHYSSPENVMTTSSHPQPQPASQNYWSPTHLAPSAYNSNGSSLNMYQYQQPYSSHYTPDGAMKGIAAEDSRLQETWTTYMSQVVPSRQMME